MQIPAEWLLGLVPPIGGWIVSVERRLSRMDAMKETMDRTDARVEKIYEHLIEKPNG